MKKPSKPVTTVGTKELVDFPILEIYGVPAKVDTGADSSAIWASNIHEDDGVLYFTLFDKQSPFYTGKELSTHSFSVASIKNSFGKTEFRYKVLLRVKIAGRNIHVRFTLANRENNSQPILIGRRTLHGKFIVDVSRDGTEKRVPRLLLMSAWISPNVATFIKGVEKAHGNLEITHATYDDMIFTFDSAGAKIRLAATGEDIASFDMIHFKTSVERDVTAAMARYAIKRGVKVVDKAVRYFPASSKLYQYAVLSDEMVPIPDTMFVMPARLEQSYDDFVGALSVPFVVKSIHASRGADNYVIKDQKMFKTISKRLVKDNVYVVAQRFIPNDGDYRVLVFGRRIAKIIHRRRLDDTTHLNNTSAGGLAKLIKLADLPTSVQIDCINAARALERGIVGVDMVQNLETGMWYCFEVNEGPQLATGAFVSEKEAAFAEYIKTELSK